MNVSTFENSDSTLTNRIDRLRTKIEGCIKAGNNGLVVRTGLFGIFASVESREFYSVLAAELPHDVDIKVHNVREEIGLGTDKQYLSINAKGEGFARVPGHFIVSEQVYPPQTIEEM